MSLLVVDKVSKAFGGVAAIREAMFTLEAGEILGIMGANGAGKTTLFNLISGSLRPDRGAIYLDGERIDGLGPDRVCRRGIARTYQIVRPFPGMTVRENVLVGALFGADQGRSAAPASQMADRILEDLRLADQAGKLAGELTLAARKRLEMARSLATRPRILLLDEVLAGLNPTEVAESLAVLRDIRRRHGVTLVIIEHVLRAIMDLCERIVVFHHGEGIAAGTPAQVVNDPAVIAAYLGGVVVSRPLLTIDGIRAGYGDIMILHGVSFTVAEGSVTALLGSNGAGKTTLMRVVAGLITPRAGAISFDGRDLTRVPASDRVEWGVSLVPEGRLIFADFTVEENLFVGASAPRPRTERDRTLRQVFDMFPILRERRRQKARVLSGGEQQMLAIGRALMARPRLLLLDEPSLGLAPKVMAQLFETVQAIRRAGLTVLIVEQNVQTTLSIADRAYVLENGRLAMEGTGPSLLSDPRIKRAYLGL